MIEIVNLKSEKPIYPYDFRVDRNTVLGNPYKINGNNRSYVCKLYKNWFNEQIEKTDSSVRCELGVLLQAYKKYGKLRLFCWCFPLQCHAETIKMWLENAYAV